jgi:hypothetical protein
MLKDVEISNFRGFADLKLHGLGRVNLVVGRNNTGKTSLIEALNVLSNLGNLGSLPGLFRTDPKAVGGRFYASLVRDGAPSGEARVLARTTEKAEWTFVIRVRHGGQPTTIDGASWTTETYNCTFAVLGPMPNLRVRAFSVEHRAPEDMLDAFAEAVRPTEGEAQMQTS